MHPPTRNLVRDPPDPLHGTERQHGGLRRREGGVSGTSIRPIGEKGSGEVVQRVYGAKGPVYDSPCVVWRVGYDPPSVWPGGQEGRDHEQARFRV